MSSIIRTSLFTRPKFFVPSTAAIFLVSGLGSLLVSEMPASPKEFSCGGGPFSFLMASLVSTTCNRDMIHLCCEAHDRCYDTRHLNQSFCDQVFCGCLSRISSSSYCELVAQPSLCLATEVFGHMFHWSAYANDENSTNINTFRPSIESQNYRHFSVESSMSPEANVTQSVETTHHQILMDSNQNRASYFNRKTPEL